MLRFQPLDTEDVIRGSYSAEEYHSFVIVITDLRVPWEFESLKFDRSWSVKQCQEFFLLTVMACVMSGGIVNVFTEDNYLKFREYIEKNKKARSLMEEAKAIFDELGIPMSVIDKNSTTQESKSSSESFTPSRFNFNNN